MIESKENPNIELAKVIVGNLISEDLILSDNEEDILLKICEGRMTAQEWKMCIERKIIKEEKTVENGKSDREN